LDRIAPQSRLRTPIELTAARTTATSARDTKNTKVGKTSLAWD
jgi:hypothetical protein